MKQAEAIAHTRALAAALILIGLALEVFGSLAVLTGVFDRVAGLALAAYCAATAVLWKQFWKPGDFWASPTGAGRSLFWDFLKNFAVAGGFLLVAFGTSAQSAAAFFAHPFEFSHPYRLQGATSR